MEHEIKHKVFINGEEYEVVFAHTPNQHKITLCAVLNRSDDGIIEVRDIVFDENKSSFEFVKTSGIMKLKLGEDPEVHQTLEDLYESGVKFYEQKLKALETRIRLEEHRLKNKLKRLESRVDYISNIVEASDNDSELFGKVMKRIRNYIEAKEMWSVKISKQYEWAIEPYTIENDCFKSFDVYDSSSNFQAPKILALFGTPFKNKTKMTENVVFGVSNIDPKWGRSNSTYGNNWVAHHFFTTEEKAREFVRDWIYDLDTYTPNIIAEARKFGFGSDLDDEKVMICYNEEKGALDKMYNSRLSLIKDWVNNPNQI